MFGLKSLIAQEWRDWRDAPVAVAGGSGKHLSAAAGKNEIRRWKTPKTKANRIKFARGRVSESPYLDGSDIGKLTELRHDLATHH